MWIGAATAHPSNRREVGKQGYRCRGTGRIDLSREDEGGPFRCFYAILPVLTLIDNQANPHFSHMHTQLKVPYDAVSISQQQGEKFSLCLLYEYKMEFKYIMAGPRD